jgi:5,10-methylene-tetrahydrofolate dehydrogenase/methenyl tetrahydrofolate cyclohydrolase
MEIITLEEIFLEENNIIQIQINNNKTKKIIKHKIHSINKVISKGVVLINLPIVKIIKIKCSKIIKYNKEEDSFKIKNPMLINRMFKKTKEKINL